MTYRNGQLPASEIMHINGVPFWVGTGNAFLAMQAEAHRDGVNIEPINEYAGYRSRSLQADGRANPGKYGVARGIIQSAVGFSTHGGGLLGFAVDIITGYAWVRKNGKRFGFSHPFVWDKFHFHHNGTTAIHSTSLASVGGVTAVPIPTEDDRMKLAIIEVSKGKFDARLIFGDGTYTEPLGPATLADWRGGQKKSNGPLGTEYEISASAWAQMVKYSKLKPRT